MIIKVRAWDDINQIMVYETPYPSRLRSGDILNRWDPEWIMQYTGMNDKKGKEIYEGDIIKFSIQGILQANPIVIKNIWDLYVEINHDDHYYQFDEESIEVIGNKFENPELLEG